MDPAQRERLIQLAHSNIPPHDPSHDVLHALRVLKNVECIQRIEGGDVQILTPAALFHDLVNYPKDDPRRASGPAESGGVAASLLAFVPGYPLAKIPRVAAAISSCSFTNRTPPASQEAAILQDADLLESLGAVSIMRTFCSSGTMQRPFYDLSDPFARERHPDPIAYAVDLFPQRLLAAAERMNTPTARAMAAERSLYLHGFLQQLERELSPSAP